MRNVKLYFTEEHKEKDLNKIMIEEDDLLLEGEFLEGDGKSYIITGIATIEGERYHSFQIKFELVEAPAEATIESIAEKDWEWYDYLC